MRASNLDSTESDFVQVMGLITRMFKQTAIAKVILQNHVNYYLNNCMFSLCSYRIK